MAASTKTPYLIIQTPKGSEKLELTAQSVWTFGRGLKNTIRLDDSFASRYHAKLQITQSQQCYFVDLDSRNGTLLNDEPLTTPTWLKHGDRISIGETTLLFEDGLVEVEDGLVEHSLETAVEPELETTPVSVLMVQGSVEQGKIWQEIFDSMNLSMMWEESSASLKQALEARALSNTLPKLLLIDVNAYANAYHFCRWCRQAFPQVQIFLLDSVRKEISSIERQITIKQGVLNFLPAMNRHDLILKSVDRLRDINEILSALETRLLSQDELLNILKKTMRHY
jgi:pSer/pThr/pTyr-binding forkhead associated (FHA) protein